MAVTYGSVVKVLGDHGFHPDSMKPGQPASTSQRFVSADPAKAGKVVVLPNIPPQKEMPSGILSLIGHNTGIPLSALMNTSLASNTGLKQNPVKNKIKPFTI